MYDALFFDLDGTLMRSDLLLESFLELLKRNLLYLFLEERLENEYQKYLHLLKGLDYHLMK